MLEIPCPWCGVRDEREFSVRAPVVARPNPDTANDAQWTTYLYQSPNACGRLREYWLHTHGCGQLFVIVRDTVTHEIVPPERP